MWGFLGSGFVWWAVTCWLAWWLPGLVVWFWAVWAGRRWFWVGLMVVLTLVTVLMVGFLVGLGLRGFPDWFGNTGLV